MSLSSSVFGSFPSLSTFGLQFLSFWSRNLGNLVARLFLFATLSPVLNFFRSGAISGWSSVRRLECCIWIEEGGMTAVMQFTTACASGRSATWGASPSCVGGTDYNKNVFHGWAAKGFRSSKCSTFCHKQSRRREFVSMGLPQDEQVEKGSRSTVRSVVHAMTTTALAVTLGLSLSLGGALSSHANPVAVVSHLT